MGSKLRNRSWALITSARCKLTKTQLDGERLNLDFVLLFYDRAQFHTQAQRTFAPMCSTCDECIQVITGAGEQWVIPRPHVKHPMCLQLHGTPEAPSISNLTAHNMYSVVAPFIRCIHDTQLHSGAASTTDGPCAWFLRRSAQWAMLCAGSRARYMDVVPLVHICETNLIQRVTSSDALVVRGATLQAASCSDLPKCILGLLPPGCNAVATAFPDLRRPASQRLRVEHCLFSMSRQCGASLTHRLAQMAKRHTNYIDHWVRPLCTAPVPAGVLSHDTLHSMFAARGTATLWWQPFKLATGAFDQEWIAVDDVMMMHRNTGISMITESTLKVPLAHSAVNAHHCGLQGLVYSAHAYACQMIRNGSTIGPWPAIHSTQVKDTTTHMMRLFCSEPQVRCSAEVLQAATLQPFHEAHVDAFVRALETPGVDIRLRLVSASAGKPQWLQAMHLSPCDHKVLHAAMLRGARRAAHELSTGSYDGVDCIDAMMSISIIGEPCCEKPGLRAAFVPGLTHCTLPGIPGFTVISATQFGGSVLMTICPTASLASTAHCAKHPSKLSWMKAQGCLRTAKDALCVSVSLWHDGYRQFGDALTPAHAAASPHLMSQALMSNRIPSLATTYPLMFDAVVMEVSRLCAAEHGWPSTIAALVALVAVEGFAAVMYVTRGTTLKELFHAALPVGPCEPAHLLAILQLHRAMHSLLGDGTPQTSWPMRDTPSENDPKWFNIKLDDPAHGVSRKAMMLLIHLTGGNLSRSTFDGDHTTQNPWIMQALRAGKPLQVGAPADSRVLNLCPLLRSETGFCACIQCALSPCRFVDPFAATVISARFHRNPNFRAVMARWMVRSTQPQHALYATMQKTFASTIMQVLGVDGDRARYEASCVVSAKELKQDQAALEELFPVSPDSRPKRPQNDTTRKPKRRSNRSRYQSLEDHMRDEVRGDVNSVVAHAKKFKLTMSQPYRQWWKIARRAAGFVQHHDWYNLENLLRSNSMWSFPRLRAQCSRHTTMIQRLADMEAQLLTHANRLQSHELDAIIKDARRTKQRIRGKRQRKRCNTVLSEAMRQRANIHVAEHQPCVEPPHAHHKDEDEHKSDHGHDTTGDKVESVVAPEPRVDLRRGPRSPGGEPLVYHLPSWLMREIMVVRPGPIVVHHHM